MIALLRTMTDPRPWLLAIATAAVLGDVARAEAGVPVEGSSVVVSH